MRVRPVSYESIAHKESAETTKDVCNATSGRISRAVFWQVYVTSWCALKDRERLVS